MSEVNQFSGMTAAEMGVKVGLEPQIDINASQVFDARTRGAIETPEELAKINQKREAQNEALRFSGKEKLKPLGVESLIETVKAEEVAIVKGEKLADDNVRKFLGEPALLGADETVVEAATGSMAKLDRMKGEAAATFAEIDEIVAKVKGDSVTEVSARVHAYNEFDQKHSKDVVEMVQNATNVVLSSEGKSRAKYLKALGIDPNTFAEQLDEDGVISNVDVLSTQIADAIDVKAAAKHKTNAGSVKSWLAKQKTTSWMLSKEDAAVVNMVDLAESYKQSEDLHKVEADTYGADYAKFDEAYTKFDKQLTRIANREKVNAEIGGAVEKGMQAESLKHQMEWQAEARKAHTEKMGAAEELVALTAQMKDLEQFAANKAVLVEQTVKAMGEISKLDAEHAAMTAKVAPGELPAEVKAIIGADSYKQVEQFIKTGGEKGNTDAVKQFVGAIDTLMQGEHLDGTGTVPAKFLSSQIVEVGGKSVELGWVVGMTTDQDVYQISLAQREPGNNDSIVPDNQNVLYLPHTEIRSLLAEIDSINGKINVLTANTSESAVNAKVARTTEFAGQHKVVGKLESKLLNTKQQELIDTKALLAETLRPLGGDEASFAKSLEQMAKGQQVIVEQLYGEAYTEAVREISESLGVAPEKVTPGYLAIVNVEATRVAEMANEVGGFLNGYDQIMASALNENFPAMKEFANELALLHQSEAVLATINHQGTRSAAERAMVEARADIDKKAKKLARKIQDSLVSSTPKVLTVPIAQLDKLISSKDTVDRATQLLKDNGLSEYADTVKPIADKVVRSTGMSEEFKIRAESIGNALSVLAKDSRSEALRAALDSGNRVAMTNIVNEIVGTKFESNITAESTKRAEAGKELGEMTGAELAKAFGVGDVNLDNIVSVVESSDGLSVDEFFDTMDDLAATPEGKKSLVELNTRILELLLDHESKGKTLAELFDKNPENWSAMLRRLARDPRFNAAYIRNAIAVAENVIAEKKT